jgi:cytochrome c2
MIVYLFQLLFLWSTPHSVKQIPEDLQRGKRLMEQRCIKCHELKTVSHYSPERWEKILPKMSRKAKLSAQESSTLGSYIQWELERASRQK